MPGKFHAYGKCPEISYTKVSDKMACANSAEEQSDQGLYTHLPFD